MDEGRHEERAVYVISVAAEMAGVHPQTLRIYERKGLLQPKRTSGNTRRYSQRDIEQLLRIQDLTQVAGINLAGVKMIIAMQDEIETMRARVAELELEVRRHRRVARAGGLAREPGAQILPLRSVLLPPWETQR
ncbi:MAG: helix-turn-helix transcriptional regulator [Actinomycetota bacterium]|nr:helix-turn-helix transcriptional regulator [Actinomycetota bacterium]